MSTNTVMHPSKTAGVAIERVTFPGGIMEIVRGNGSAWVSVKSACEAMGVDAEAQRKRLKAAEWAETSIIEVSAPIQPNDALAAVLRSPNLVVKTFCLKAECAPMWLATFDASRIKEPTARAQVKLWQKHATAALFAYVKGEPAPALPAPPALPPAPEPPKNSDLLEVMARELVAQLQHSRQMDLARMTAPRAVAAPRPERAPAAPADPKPAARPRKPATPAPVKAPPPAPAEQWVAGSLLADRLGMRPDQLQKYLRSNPGFREHQRGDGRWALGKALAAHKAQREAVEQRRAAQRTAAEQERDQYAAEYTAKLRTHTVKLVVDSVQRSGGTPNDYGDAWRVLYREFAKRSGYDPTGEREKGKNALDVVIDRGDMQKLHDLAVELLAQPRPQ